MIRVPRTEEKDEDGRASPPYYPRDHVFIPDTSHANVPSANFIVP